MDKMFFIGTLHKGLTNLQELEELILSYNPDLLGLEITHKDLISNNVSHYPNEMIFALELAKKHKMKFFGFDSDIKVMNDDVDEENILIEQKELIKKNNWKDFNKLNLTKKLNQISKPLFNQEKWEERELEMEQNILKNINNEKSIVLTGVGHIDFFKKKFPNSKFLY